MEKILGAEYADKVAADVAADLKPWYLRQTYNPQEILIDNDNTVRGGTVPALVERLTDHDNAGNAILTAASAYVFNDAYRSSLPECFPDDI